MILETEIRVFYEEFKGVKRPPKNQRLIIDMSEVIGAYELESDEQYEENTTRIILKSGEEIRILFTFDEFSIVFKEYIEQKKNDFLKRLN